MHKRVFLILSVFLLGVLLLATACGQEPAASGKSPTPATATQTDGCVGCHTNKATLQKLATPPPPKSEAIQGES